MKKIYLKRIIIMFFIIFFPTILIVMNVQGYKDEPNFGCHSKGNYTITADVSSITAQVSEKYDLKITASGTNVVVDVFSEAFDNEVFKFSPGTIIADGDAADTDPTTNAIEVILKITMPSSEGQYTLRILSRGSSTSGTFPLWYLDLEVYVGTNPPPPNPPPPNPTISSTSNFLGIIVPIAIIIGFISISGFVVHKRIQKQKINPSNKNLRLKKKDKYTSSKYGRITSSSYRNIQPRRRSSPHSPEYRRSTSPSYRSAQSRQRRSSKPYRNTQSSRRKSPPSQGYKHSPSSPYRSRKSRR